LNALSGKIRKTIENMYAPAFARRTSWNFTQNDLSKCLDELKKENTPFIDLTLSNPTQCGFDYPSEIYSSLSNENNKIYEPQAQGVESARRSVADYYQTCGYSVDPENIYLAASTSEAYGFIFRLLADPGEKIYFPQPSYPLFQFLTDLNDVLIDNYVLDYHKGWSIDPFLFNSQPEGHKAICVVNPNNPTGSYIKEKELGELNKFCQRHSLSLIADEVFWDYNLKKISSRVSLVNNKEVLTFVMGGLSKTLGLPQMKLSWIVVNGPEALVKEAKLRMEVICDTFLSVSSPTQYGFSQWMEHREAIQRQIKKRTQENLKYVNDHLNCLEVEGGWYAIVLLDEKVDEEEFVLRLLREDNTYVHPGYYYDFPKNGQLVLSLLPEANTFQEGCQRIKRKL